MKEEIKAPEKIQLSDEEIDNLSDAQLKTLVIRMLTELFEYGQKIEEEEVKAMQNEIKENIQRTNNEGKETGTQINGLEHNILLWFHHNRMKKQEFKKMKGGLGTSGTTLNVPTSKS